MAYWFVYTRFLLFLPSYLMPGLCVWLFFLLADFRHAARSAPRLPFALPHWLALLIGTTTVFGAEVLFQLRKPDFAGGRFATSFCGEDLAILGHLSVCFVPIYLGIVATLLLLAVGVGRTASRSLDRRTGITLAALVLVSPLNLVAVGVALGVVVLIGLFGDRLVRRRLRQASDATTIGENRATRSG